MYLIKFSIEIISISCIYQNNVFLQLSLYIYVVILYNYRIISFILIYTRVYYQYIINVFYTIIYYPGTELWTYAVHLTGKTTPGDICNRQALRYTNVTRPYTSHCIQNTPIYNLTHQSTLNLLSCLYNFSRFAFHY